MVFGSIACGMHDLQYLQLDRTLHLENTHVIAALQVLKLCEENVLSRVFQAIRLDSRFWDTLLILSDSQHALHDSCEP